MVGLRALKVDYNITQQINLYFLPLAAFGVCLFVSLLKCIYTFSGSVLTIDKTFLILKRLINNDNIFICT